MRAHPQLGYRGGVLHIQSVGDGPQPLVALHGFLGSGRNLGGLARSLVARDPSLRISLVDLPGHGRSPPLRDEDTLSEMAQSILDWASSTDPIDILGHSLGGRVALQMRIMAPERVRRSILLDISPGSIEGSETETVIETLLKAPSEAGSRDTMRQALEAEGLSSGLIAWLLMNGGTENGRFVWRIDRARLERFHRENRSRDLWAGVGPDVVQIYGAQSTYLSDGDLRSFEDRGVPCIRIEKAGHFLHADQTEKVTDAVLSALASQASRPAVEP